MKKVLSMILVLSMVFVLVACGGKRAAGEYVLKTMTMDGQEMKMEDLSALGVSADSFKLVLNEDGTGLLEVMGQEQKLTWNDKSLTAEGESIDYTLSGNELTMEQDGNTMVFVRK